MRVLPWGTNGLRLVTHRLIGDADVEEAIATIVAVVAASSGPEEDGPPGPGGTGSRER